MNTVEQQRYIEALRAEAKTKSIRHEEEIDAYEVKLFDLKVMLGVIIAVLVLAVVWLGLENFEYSDQVSKLTQAQRADTDLQQRFDNVLEDWHYQSKRATELEQCCNASH